MGDRDLPWAAMLKVAGVTVAEVAEAAGLSSDYVYKQLRGDRPLQYPVERACRDLVRLKQEAWYPAVALLVRILHDGKIHSQVSSVMWEFGSGETESTK